MGPRLTGFLLLISLAICCPVQSAKVEKIVTSPKLEAFKNWLSENGARLDNLVITKAAAYGTTAVAPRDLGRGESLVYLPVKLMVNVHMINNSAVAQANPSALPGHKAAFWLLEQLHDPNSFWKPWLEILPKRPSLPVMWTDGELQQLQDLSLVNVSLERNLELKRKYDEIFGSLEEQDEALSWFNKVTLDDFKWAMSIVWSRGYTSDEALGKYYVFVPVEDLFSLQSPTAVESMTRVRVSEDGLGVQYLTKTDIEKGEVIEKLVPRAQYFSNSRLLFDFGVMFDQNPNNAIGYRTPYDPKTLKFNPRKAVKEALLKAAQVDGETFFIKKGEEFQEALCVYRIMQMALPEYEDKEALQRAVDCRFLGEETEKRAVKEFIKSVKIYLDDYFWTTLEDDVAMLQDDASGLKALSPNIRRALQLRVSNKRIWFSLKSNLEKYLRQVERDYPESTIPRTERPKPPPHIEERYQINREVDLNLVPRKTPEDQRKPFYDYPSGRASTFRSSSKSKTSKTPKKSAEKDEL